MQNLAIFGAGQIGKFTKKLVEDKYYNEYKLVYFVDNDPAKQGSLIENIPVISREKLLDYWGRGIDYIALGLNKYYFVAVFLLSKNITPVHITHNGVIPINTEEFSLPKHIRLEASTLCQLNCKTCYMRKYNSGTVGKGYLKFSDFKNFIQNNKFVKEIELANSGEIFLNPDLIHILKYAFENNITLYANGGNNFNSVPDEVLDGLVKYRFKSMTISIDGASQETYEQYRVNGNFGTVIENIEKLNNYKKKYSSQFPELLWQYIIMEHNENDIIKAKAMAEELNMKIRFKLTWDPGYIPKNIDMLQKETGLKFFSREEHLKKAGMPYGFMCNQLWQQPQINYDGRLLGCCGVFTNDFGINVFEVGLEEAINHKNYKYAKKMLMGEAEVPERCENIPCANCGHYKKMRETGIYLHNIY